MFVCCLRLAFVVESESCLRSLGVKVLPLRTDEAGSVNPSTMLLKSLWESWGWEKLKSHKVHCSYPKSVLKNKYMKHLGCCKPVVNFPSCKTVIPTVCAYFSLAFLKAQNPEAPVPPFWLTSWESYDFSLKACFMELSSHTIWFTHFRHTIRSFYGALGCHPM